MLAAAAERVISFEVTAQSPQFLVVQSVITVIRASRGGYGVGLQPCGLQAPRNGHMQLPLSWETTSKTKQRWVVMAKPSWEPKVS